MEEWLNSITDLDLRAATRKSLLVSGGSICSLFLGEPVNDYDVYIQDIDVLKRLCVYYTKDIQAEIWDGRNKSSLLADYEAEGVNLNTDPAKGPLGIGMLQSALRNLKEDQLKIWIDSHDPSGGLTVNEDQPKNEGLYLPVHFSQNAISLTDDLQIVVRFSGTPEQIHKSFDFIHATNFFSFKDGLVRNQKALESILTKTLRYQGSMYPVTSIIRSKKFVKRGFGISAGEYLKIMFQISELDLTDLDTLTEQTQSVDCQYFSYLIAALSTKLQKDPNFKVESKYVNAILDRIFNEEGGELEDA
jgi:hypothetical protein